MTIGIINIVTALAAFIISGALGLILIPLLRRIKAGQTILDIGPAWHKSKEGTPTMGGFMFIISTIAVLPIAYFLFKNNVADSFLDTDVAKNNMFKMLACVVFALLNGAIGFADDYIKVVKKRNLGLKAFQKMFWQLLFACGFLAIMYVLGDRSTLLDFSFFKLNLGIFYYPIMVLVIIYLTNAVNLTDGIDGLAGSVTLISMLIYANILTLFNASPSTWGLPNREVMLLCMTVAGGLLGFLIWNMHPAKCFMGDTGSMFLGGVFTAIAILTHKHLILIFVGIIFIAEALSVVLQVLSFKLTGKRIFKMSPIHHHFEMCKWGEYKIVAVFSIVQIIFGILAVLVVNSTK